jgi:hypothetical protein
VAHGYGTDHSTHCGTLSTIIRLHLTSMTPSLTSQHSKAYGALKQRLNRYFAGVELSIIKGGVPT